MPKILWLRELKKGGVVQDIKNQTDRVMDSLHPTGPKDAETGSESVKNRPTDV